MQAEKEAGVYMGMYEQEKKNVGNGTSSFFAI
jgi:hypothetical protein